MNATQDLFSPSTTEAVSFVDAAKQRITAMSANQVEELMASFDNGAGGVHSHAQGSDEEMLDALVEPRKTQPAQSERKGDSAVMTLLKKFATHAVQDGTLAPDHAEKLVATAHFDLGGLENALAAIPLSKDKKSYRRYMAQKVRPSLGNSFYKPDVLLENAAYNTWAYFKEADNWLVHYRDSFIASSVAEMLRKPKSRLNTILTHMTWTAEFVTIGRRDMDLTMLPDRFFGDVLPLVMHVVDLFEYLSKWKGCAALRAKGMVKAEIVLGQLEYLQLKRKRIGENMREEEEVERAKAREQATFTTALAMRPANSGS